MIKKITFLKKWPLLSSVVMALLLLLTLLDTWFAGLGWFNQHRALQLMLSIVAAATFLFTTQSAFTKSTLFGLAVIFALGLLSSSLANYPFSALKELALYAGFIFFILLANQQAKIAGANMLLLFAMAAIAFVNAYQFFIYYLMAFVTGIYILDASMLWTGFSNPRTLNQFQGMFLPVLAYLFLYCRSQNFSYSRLLVSLLFVCMVLQWCIAFTTGGRAFYLSMAVSHLALLALFWRFRHLVFWQFLAALLGCALFAVCFLYIPDLIGEKSKFISSLRTDSSSRWPMWQAVWQIFLQQPWLGVGPMHLAAFWDLPVPSPHQTILQFLAEWGLIAASIFVFIVIKGVWLSSQYIKSRSADHLDAALWLVIITRLITIQFEGPSSPYSMLWFALLLGIALQRWSTDYFVLASSPWLHKAWKGLALFTIVVFVWVLIFELPYLAQAIEQFMETHPASYLKPRFWSQGLIPMTIE